MLNKKVFKSILITVVKLIIVMQASKHFIFRWRSDARCSLSRKCAACSNISFLALPHNSRKKQFKRRLKTFFFTFFDLFFRRQSGVVVALFKFTLFSRSYSRESQQRWKKNHLACVINVKIYCSCLMLTVRISGTKSKCEKLFLLIAWKIPLKQFIKLSCWRGS